MFLLTNVNEPTKILVENVTKGGWTISEIVTILAALLAAAVSGIGIWQQKRLASERIKADLIANARIDWIQKARDTTAEMITYVMKYQQIATELDGNISAINNGDKTGRAFGRINQSYEAINKLILMFGPEKGESKNSTDLNNEDTNDYKNKMIVEELKGLRKLLEEDEIKLISKTTGTNKDEIKGKIDNLTDFFRIYYKIEWKKVTETHQ